MELNLTPLGLTERESQIYSTLLKLGKTSVKEIAKSSGMHRTNIYDILEQLKEKGIVSFVKEGSSTIYEASNPNNLYTLLEDKKKYLDSIFPNIEEFFNKPQSGVNVEVFKGKNGMKIAFNDMLKEGSDIYAYGVNAQLRGYLPIYYKQWIRQLKEKGITLHALFTQRVELPDTYDVKYISKEFASPVSTVIYGDKVNINIWEPALVSIVITSPIVAHSYRQHFDLLWKLGKR